MTERVKKLRDLSLNTLPYLSPERAKILTDFCKRSESYPTVIQRALAFMEIMEMKEIYIGEGELIVGERGPAPKATYTYPEICCHTLNDLDILNTREKIPFKVDDEMKQLYEQEIIPFWKNKSIREKIFENMTDGWKASYSAGIFTEFMEQRAPGHTVLDDKIYKKGMLDFKKDIETSLASIDSNDSQANSKRDELAAMSITVEGIINLSSRYANKAGKLALKENNPVRKAELEKIEKICRRVPSYKPESFWEALQYYWFVHLGVITELNPWDAFNGLNIQ